MSLRAELASEQMYVDNAYERLEEMRERARSLGEAALRGASSTHQSMLERDVFVHLAEKRLADLTIGREALVFGRIDRVDGERFYIGRLAVADEHQEPLVVDWRAPVSEPFYRGTARNPMGVFRRRHFATKGRKILDIEDELLDEPSSSAEKINLIGEGALIEALERSRTGRMHDIVETIQAEQDEVIRAPLQGILIVQGGPGTGKTAVALHRAAYLLYTHRTRLTRSGVLFVGPNPVFLRYVEHVLPSLGEQDTRLSTAANLAPRMRVNSAEPVDVAAIKGDARMAEVIRNAVRELGRPLREDVSLWYESRHFFLRADAIKQLVSSLRRSRIPHNARRKKIEQRLLDHLFDEFRKSGPPRALSLSAAGKQDRLEFNEAMLSDERFIKAVDTIWPLVTAEELVRSTVRSKERLRAAGRRILTSAEIDRLTSSYDEAVLTEGDAALIDEAWVHLGPVVTGRKRPDDPEAEDVAFFVDRVLSDMEGLDSHMKAYLRERLAGEARRDRDDEGMEEEEGIRVYGHVLVDEAQDLTPMQWRMIARRCPSGSVTVFGDLGQASKPWAPKKWDEILEHLPETGSRMVELTINYRTPSEVMDMASRVLAEAAPSLVPPTSVRSSGEPPRFVKTEPAMLMQSLAAMVGEEVREVQGGKVAVIVPDELRDDALAEIPQAAGTESVDVLEVTTAVLTVDQAKGLEFDSVIVVEPAMIAANSSGGLRGLYVSMTRTTKRLTLLYSGDLPQVLEK